MRTIFNNAHGNSGFIALTTVLIITAVLVIIGASLGTSGYFHRLGMYDYESKEHSYFLAYSCIDIARFKLEEDLDYFGNEIITIASESCKIFPITYSGFNTIIDSVASASGNYTRLKFTMDELLKPVSFIEY